MMTVHEVSKLAGVSIRTLQYYDKIGLCLIEITSLPMKALLDRLVYGMNKYYGDKKGPSLWAGKDVALVSTCGYPPEKGADLWEAGMKRYCKHSQLRYLGMLCQRHLGYNTVFMDEEKAARARAFANGLLRQLAV